MSILRRLVPACLAIALAGAGAAHAQQPPSGAPATWLEQGWAITGWTGRLSTENTSDLWTLSKVSFENSYVGAIAVSKELLWWGDSATLDAELQTLRHFGGQDHWEFTSMLVFRWKDFGWDDTIDTDVAIGMGPSYPTEIPAEELYQHTRGNSGRLLNSLMAEFAFADPDVPDWQYVLRWHHRSGMFRTFSDVGEASSVFGFGIKKKF